MSRKHSRPLTISEIRVISQHILLALKALKIIGMADSDITMNNIMFVSHTLQPYRVKLIDFGRAKDITELKREKNQTKYYFQRTRSPL